MKSARRAPRTAAKWGGSRAEWLLAGGLATVALANWSQWRREKRRAGAINGQPLDRPTLAATPRVSILVPAWNEEASVGPCVESILALNYPEKELVICAGGGDGTLESARRYAKSNVIVLEQQRGEGKQGALQRCFERASGEIIFLTDADCLLDDESFERTIAPLINEGDQVATGALRPLDSQLDHTFVAFQFHCHPYMGGRSPKYVGFLGGINAAVRRGALEAVGAFSSRVPIGTDYYLAQKLLAAGYQVRFVPNSRVQTEFCTHPLEYVTQQSRWFRIRFVHDVALRKWWATFSYLRAGLGAQFLLAVPVTGGLASKPLWYPWAIVVVHLALRHIRQVRLAQLYKGLRVAPRRRYSWFALYATLDWMALAMGLLESLSPKRRWRW